MKINFVIVMMMIYRVETAHLFAQPITLPLVQMEDFIYQGAFTIPAENFGASSANYSTGSIAYNPINHSLFLSGFNLDGAIAEFAIPPLVNSKEVITLNSATILQNFRPILNASSDNNPQNIDEITGMELIGGKLFINAVEYYDAPGDNTHTTLVLENPFDITNSTVSGYYSLGGAAHAAGWLSQIPPEWQTLLGGSYITGSSSKYPINGRLTMGISAFVINFSTINTTSFQTIPTTPLLDFDLTHPLYADYASYKDANYNLIEVNDNLFSGHTFEDAKAIIGQNNLWTEVSQASYGFIVPNSSTYVTLGSSGGHHSGIGYKPIQNNGNLCGGPCPYDAKDNYNYYWLWKVNELMDVKNGLVKPYEVRPYAYGVFEVPFQIDAYTNTPEFHPIVGGTYNSASGLLYLSIYDGASINNPFEKIPVIAVYKIKQTVLSVNEETLPVIDVYPNPTKDFFTFSLNSNQFKKVIIYNQLGQQIMTVNKNRIDASNWSTGIYFVKISLQSGQIINKKLIKL